MGFGVDGGSFVVGVGFVVVVVDRSIFRIFDGSDVANVGWSGGTNTPSCRNVFTFDVLIKDDADGDNRIIGSPILVGFDGFFIVGFGVIDMFILDLEYPGRTPPGYGCPGLDDLFRPMNVSDILRMFEKSYQISNVSFIHFFFFFFLEYLLYIP